MPQSNDRDFWSRQPLLVWSNPLASDSVYIRAALLKPRFHTLLKIAVKFGLDRLEKEWLILRNDRMEQTSSVECTVERVLTNIEKGFKRAAR